MLSWLLTLTGAIYTCYISFSATAIVHDCTVLIKKSDWSQLRQWIIVSKLYSYVLTRQRTCDTQCDCAIVCDWKSLLAIGRLIFASSECELDIPTMKQECDEREDFLHRKDSPWTVGPSASKWLEARAPREVRSLKKSVRIELVNVVAEDVTILVKLACRQYDSVTWREQFPA